MHRGKRHVFTLLAWAAFMYGLAVGLLWAFQYRLIYQPPGPSPRPWGSLTLARPDGTLHGWIVHPHARDALVLFGGNAMALAPVMAAWSGCTRDALVLMPYRGYEGQAGTPREAAMVGDGIALVRQVQRTHVHVLVAGVSLGSGVASQVAAVTHPARVLLITPYDSLDAVAHDHFPWVPTHWLMHDRFDSAAAAKHLSGTPVVILQADDDEIVRAARTRALARAIPGGPMAWIHVPTTHNGVWEGPALCSLIRTQTRAVAAGKPAQ